MRTTPKTKFTAAEVERRCAFESQFAECPTADPVVLKLFSGRGFAFYFLEIRDLYSSPKVAYEQLEQLRIAIIGRRYYSGWDSFRKVLGRNLKNGWKR